MQQQTRLNLKSPKKKVLSKTKDRKHLKTITQGNVKMKDWHQHAWETREPPAGNASEYSDCVFKITGKTVHIKVEKNKGDFLKQEFLCLTRRQWTALQRFFKIKIPAKDFTSNQIILQVSRLLKNNL